jgi:hypothetical protein
MNQTAAAAAVVARVTGKSLFMAFYAEIQSGVSASRLPSLLIPVSGLARP